MRSDDEETAALARIARRRFYLRGRPRRSVAALAHAALQCRALSRRLRFDPRSFRRHRGGAFAGLHRGRFFLQRRHGPLSALQRLRRGKNRDAVSRRRFRHLPRLRRPPLPGAAAADPVSRQERPRSPRDDRRRGAQSFRSRMRRTSTQQRAQAARENQRQARPARRSGARLSAARPAAQPAFRRRGAAHQAAPLSERRADRATR